MARPPLPRSLRARISSRLPGHPRHPRHNRAADVRLWHWRLASLAHHLHRLGPRGRRPFLARQHHNVVLDRELFPCSFGVTAGH